MSFEIVGDITEDKRIKIFEIFHEKLNQLHSIESNKPKIVYEDKDNFWFNLDEDTINIAYIENFKEQVSCYLHEYGHFLQKYGKSTIQAPPNHLINLMNKLTIKVKIVSALILWGILGSLCVIIYSLMNVNPLVDICLSFLIVVLVVFLRDFVDLLLTKIVEILSKEVSDFSIKSEIEADTFSGRFDKNIMSLVFLHDYLELEQNPIIYQALVSNPVKKHPMPSERIENLKKIDEYFDVIFDFALMEVTIKSKVIVA